jgi:hypothetical protein
MLIKMGMPIRLKTTLSERFIEKILTLDRNTELKGMVWGWLG